MKVVDKRYHIIQMLLECGSIEKFTDIFNHISLSVAARDLGITRHFLQKKIASPEKFTLNDIMVLSDLIGRDCKSLLKMTMNEIESTNQANASAQ